MITFNQHLINQQKSAKKGERTLNLSTSLPLMPTGNMYFDANNGINHIVYDEKEVAIAQYHNVGVAQGSVNGIIAKSNVGKTQFVVSLMAAMALPYIIPSLSKAYQVDEKVNHDGINSMIIIADSEHTFELSNFKRISKMSNKQMKDCVSLVNITTDKDLIKLIESHANFKETSMKPMLHPLPDLFGNPIVHYPPTFMLIDSMSNVMTEGTEVAENFDKGTNNMAGAQRAKKISFLTTLMVEYAQKYNITFFTINHINKKIQTGFMPEPKQYRGLKQDETLNGGEKGLYLSTNIWRLDLVKEISGDPKKTSHLNLGSDVTGMLVRVTQIKSKTNVFGRSCHLIATTDESYSQLISNLYEGIIREHIKKSGNFYYLDKYPDIKFSLKNNKYKEIFSDPKMMAALYDQLTQYIEPLLSSDSLEKGTSSNDKSKGIVIKEDDDIDDVSASLSSIEALFNEE